MTQFNSKFNTEFTAALPAVIKWSVNENQYDESGDYPQSLSLFIPAESIAALADYLSALATDNARLKTAKIWDYSAKEEKEVQGVYLNAKGKRGRDGGAFGNINPAALQRQAPAASAPDDDAPF